MSTVSVILPYYKKKKYIKKTILSILKQTFHKFEIIIIDDECSYESKIILDDIKILDKRIILIKNKKKLGVGYARNLGIKKAKGKFIAFCDADDLWANSKLNEQLKFMKSLKAQFSFTSYNIIDEYDNLIGERHVPKKIYFNELIKSCKIGLSTVILEKKLFDKINILFPKIKTKEDYVLWLKLSQRGTKMYGMNKNLTSWRKSENSLSSSYLQKILDGYKVYRRYLNYSFVRSIFSLIILSINKIFKN